MKTSKPVVSPIQPDIAGAIRKAWPRGIVESFADAEDSYLAGRLSKLQREFASLTKDGVLWERSSEGGPVWSEDSDREDDPPDWEEPSRSYHLFFLTPPGKSFSKKITIEDLGPFEEEFDENGEPIEPGEDGREDEPRVINGENRWGWSAAVSLVAPFAMISPGAFSTFEDGTSSEPQLEMHIQAESGEWIDPDDALREALGEQEMKALHRLRERIVALLESHGVRVLPREELRKCVPRLRADEEILVQSPLTVRDAFFFEVP